MTISTPTALTYTPPDRATQSASAFSGNANDFATEMKVFGNELITIAGEINTDFGVVNGNTSDILAAATAATTAANYLGEWSSLTGSVDAGSSCKHDGQLWVSNGDIADVTTEEPGTSVYWDQIGGIVREARTSNAKLRAVDYSKVIDYTSGTFTQTFDSAATLGEGWSLTLINSGNGTITLDPDGSETINGSSTLALKRREVAIITCDGSDLYANKLQLFDDLWGELIQEETPSGVAAVDLDMSSAGDYEYLYLEIEGLTQSATSTLDILLSNDGGSSFETGASDYAWASGGTSDSNDDSIRVWGAATTDEIQLARIWIRHADSGSVKTAMDGFSKIGIQNVVTGLAAERNTAEANDYLRILPGSGNISARSIKLYGIGV